MSKDFTDSELVELTVAAYNAFSDDYVSYSDGDVRNHLYDFKERQYSFADAKLWKKIKEVIAWSQKGNGKSPISVLDVGCGPGTWLLRLADTFSADSNTLSGVGGDKSPSMIQLANQHLSNYLTNNPGRQLDLSFSEIDLTESLPYADNQFDVSLCLYTVLNHIPISSISTAIQEMWRVTKKVNVSVVRSVLGMPTVYVCGLGKIEEYKQTDNLLTFRHQNGYTGTLISHLFTYQEIIDAFEKVSRVKECFGLDIFMSRFFRPSAWIRNTKEILPVPQPVLEQLQMWEEKVCHDPSWVDFGNHIVIITVPREENDV